MRMKSPGLVLDCLIAFQTVTPAHKIGAASAKSIPSGIGVRCLVNETQYLENSRAMLDPVVA